VEFARDQMRGDDTADIGPTFVSASFNRAFATYAAMTPGEYRKRTRSPL